MSECELSLCLFVRVFMFSSSTVVYYETCSCWFFYFIGSWFVSILFCWIEVLAFVDDIFTHDLVEDVKIKCSDLCYICR